MLKVGGNGRFGRYRLTGQRMSQLQPPGMQRLPGKTAPERSLGLVQTPRAALAAVHRVADQGMTDMLHMDPNLVRAAGLQFHIQSACRMQPMTQAVVGHCPSAVGANDLAAPVDRMSPERGIDAAAGDHRPPDHGKVVALDFAPLELLHQSGVGLQCARDQQAAAGVLVEAMNQSGTRQGRQLRIEVQEPVDQRAGGIAGAGMNHQSGRFVDDQKGRVVDQHSQRHRLGLRIPRVRLEHGLQLDSFAFGEPEVRLDLPTVDAQLPGPDPFTETTARELRPGLRCGLVDPQTGLLGGNLDPSPNRT